MNCRDFCPCCMMLYVQRCGLCGIWSCHLWRSRKSAACHACCLACQCMPLLPWLYHWHTRAVCRPPLLASCYPNGLFPNPTLPVSSWRAQRGAAQRPLGQRRAAAAGGQQLPHCIHPRNVCASRERAGVRQVLRHNKKASCGLLVAVVHCCYCSHSSVHWEWRLRLAACCTLAVLG